MRRRLWQLSIFLILFANQADAVSRQPAALPVPSREDSPAQAAISAYLEDHTARARELAAPLAEQGDADALFLMGFTLESPEPAKLSRGQAMDYYYRRASAAGHPEAAGRRLLIALCSGIEKDRKEAQATLESTSEKGDARSSRLLGEAWLRGLVDGKADLAKAAEYWKKAAAAGDASASVLLGKLHEGVFGQPDRVDLKAALGFYRDAAGHGDSSAMVLAATLLLGTDPAVQNEAEGREWLHKAIAAKNCAAWQLLGDYEMRTEKNTAAALDAYRAGAAAGQAECMFRLASTGESAAASEWLRKAADAGSSNAAAELGHRLFTTDHVAGCRYLTVAANDGVPRAQHELGLIYLDGSLGYKDATAAVAWLTEAMKSGDAEMQYKLGTLHEEGIGCPINYANAGVLYTMACNKGHAAAAARIAHLSSEGLGMKRDPYQAWAYATLAVERGDASAKTLVTALEKEIDPHRPELQKTLSDLREAAKKPAWSSEKARASSMR